MEAISTQMIFKACISSLTPLPHNVITHKMTHFQKIRGPREPVIPTPTLANTLLGLGPESNHQALKVTVRRVQASGRSHRVCHSETPLPWVCPAPWRQAVPELPGLGFITPLGGSLPSSGFSVAGEGTVPAATRSSQEGWGPAGGVDPWCEVGAFLVGGVCVVLPTPLCWQGPQERGRNWPGDPLFSHARPPQLAEANGEKKKEEAGMVLVKAAPR